MELLFLEPVFKEAIWGGTKLRDSFGYDIPSDTTGECWAISAHKNGDCKIAGGRYDGKYLSQLWEEEPELFGNYPGDQFPLLIKIIDAKNDLSIQVHPDDAYAAEHENGSLGKTECWYVLDCEPDTKIVIGHNAKDKKELEEMIRQGRWSEFIRVVDVKRRFLPDQSGMPARDQRRYRDPGDTAEQRYHIPCLRLRQTVQRKTETAARRTEH